VGVKYANATTSGNTTLHPALGVGPSDEVITTPFTFAASATASRRCDPHICRHRPQDPNLDSELVKFTDTAKAVVLVYLAGYPAEMGAFMKLADRYGL
jgi:perosamine synthetase